LKKAGVEGLTFNVQLSTFNYDLTKHEIELIEQISRFPQTVAQAANEYRPLVMAAYAYDLANTFHSFYHAVNVPLVLSCGECFADRRRKNAECPTATGDGGKADNRKCTEAAKYSSARGHVENRLNVIYTFSLFYL